MSYLVTVTWSSELRFCVLIILQDIMSLAETFVCGFFLSCLCFKYAQHVVLQKTDKNTCDFSLGKKNT